VQGAAIKALARTGAANVPRILLHTWPAQPPEMRALILEQMLGREAWALALLQSVEHGQIAAVDLEAAHRNRLLKHASENVRSLAAKVFAATSNPDRQHVIESFRPALALRGEPLRGK